MPAVAQPYTPPAVQGNVIALFSQGSSKRSIAKELGIARSTVDSILARYSQTEPIQTGRLQRILPKAYDAVEKAVTGGDARIAMDLLKLELGQRSEPAVHVHGDATFQTAVSMMSGPPAQPSTTSTAMSTESSVSSGTEAAAQTGTQFLDLRSQANFSQFSLAELEQEVARRKSLLIEAEVVEAEVING